MVKAFILLWDTINSHPLSISLDTSELMKTKWENTESYCNCRVLGFFFFPFLIFILLLLFSSLLPYLKKHYVFWYLHWSYHGEKILQWGMFCWTLAQTTFSSVSRRRQGYLLTSTLPLLPHFSSVSSCPTSHADDPPGSPFHCPHLNFRASQPPAQGRAPALNNACTVPHIRWYQYYFSFWFITKVARNKHTVFAIFYLQQVRLSFMAGWSQRP